MKRIGFAVPFLLMSILAACNLPFGPAPAPAGARATLPPTAAQGGGAIQLGGQPEPTGAPGYAQVTLPPQVSTPVPNTPPSSTGNNPLTISDVQVSTLTYYFGEKDCGPTQTTITVKVTGGVGNKTVGVLRLFGKGNAVGSGGRSDFMQPVGNDRYSLIIPTADYDDSTYRTPDNYRVDLVFFAEDSAGNQVATGEWGDMVGDGHLWPLNPIQIQIPTLQYMYCYKVIAQTEVPHVDMPTFTPTPYLELPTSTPLAQTRSGYVELRDWDATGDTADMDFSGANELAYIAANSEHPDVHGLGQNVNQGEGIMMALVSSPSYDTCRSIGAWNPGISPVHVGETYCYLTAGGTYGYFHIDSIENRGMEIDNWVIGLSYVVWIP